MPPKSPFVSVIVPIYGVEQYIERCARSLFEQTMVDNIEYIFVNDCTKDSSMDILNKVILEYPNRKDQIVVITHDNNKGLPIARQSGLAIAKGTYICHCDSDDWCEKDCYKSLYTKAIKEDADVVICDYKTINENGESLVVNACNFTTHNELLYDVSSQRISPSVWNKMVKRNLYNEVVFYPQHGMGEDMVLTIQLLNRAKNVVHLREPLYCYFINSQSMSFKPGKEAILKRFYQIKENTDLVIKYIENYATYDVAQSIIDQLCYNSISQIQNLIYYDKSIRRIWLTQYPGLFKRLLMSYRFPIIKKMQIILTFINVYPFPKDRVK